MKKEMADLVSGMLNKGQSIDQVRQVLLEQGYLEHDINNAISADHVHANIKKKNQQKKLNITYMFKEIFDRIGFGVTSQQFINIFLSTMGAGLFVVGIITGAKVVLSSLTSSVLKGSLKQNEGLKRNVVIWGIMFLASIGLLYFSAGISYWAFAFALIFSAIVLVVYGDLYSRLYKSSLIQEKKNFFLKKSSQIGIIISAVSIFAAAYLLEHSPFFRESFQNIFIIAFAAFALSLVALLFVKVPKKHKISRKNEGIVKQEFKDAVYDLKSVFLKNKLIMTMLFAGSITGVVQSIGAAYYGIFIYQNLKGQWLGGFVNVGLVFSLALVTSIIASYVTQKMAQDYGKAPMLVFGTLLIALMPLTFYVNPNLVAIIIATISGVIGNSIVGVARGLLSVEYLTQEEQQSYYRTGGLITTVPYILLFPIGAYVAYQYGLGILFLTMAVTLLVTAFPLYFLVVLRNPTKRI